jgi:hypothetical protein
VTLARGEVPRACVSELPDTAACGGSSLMPDNRAAMCGRYYSVKRATNERGREPSRPCPGTRRSEFDHHLMQAFEPVRRDHDLFQEGP